MFTHKFYIRTKKNNALMLRITNNRKTAEIGMGYNMTEAQLADCLSDKPTRANQQMASLIRNWENRIIDVKVELDRTQRVNETSAIIADMIKTELWGKPIVEPKEVVKTGEFMNFFAVHTATYDKRSTRESNEYTMSTLRKYDKDVDNKRFTDINYAWLSDFEVWMIRKELSQNTRKIHFGNIRACIREAYKRELTDIDPFRRFTFRPGKTQKRSLTIRELREFIELEVEDYQQFYKDMFLLSFYLIGINTADLAQLQSITNEGRVEFFRAKTDRRYSIKVEPEALAIIEKYRGKKGLLSIADRWTDYRNFRHQLNQALKNMGSVERVGRGGKKMRISAFPELTSYWARHTWATIAYNECGITEDVISQALGHSSSFATTSIYINRYNKLVDRANRLVIDRVLYDKRERW